MTREPVAEAAPDPSGAASAAVARQPSNPWDRYGWLMAVIWLFFLIYPAIALVESDAAPIWIGVGWTAMAAFVVLYVGGFIRGMRRGAGLGRPVPAGQWWIFGGMIACALVYIPAGGVNALGFLPFIMSFASYGLTRPAHWITTIGGVVLTALCVSLLPGGMTFISILAIVALLGVVNTVSTSLIIRSSQADRLGLELATSEARETVARDVHDLIGHSLTVVQLKSQLAARLIDTDPERAKAELADITALTTEAIAGVRATVAGVRATTLVEQLASARDVLRAAGIDMSVAGESSSLSPAQSLTASWVLREAITNVLRHAKATSVSVTIEPGRLIVVDDGCGPSQAAEDADGSGLRGMRERAAAAGAAFEFGPGPDRGTRVEIRW
ncbi:histidine kinase [Microbacterium sp. H1-D42]|uniref:sensor histidine kinase n=1 Tax=Microbacterium sp. H1-D42 TaxID=2925844 RepID=UPI001F5326E7|nr:histidine kinase [Microbacterium sp. H1-D42]UNK69982.1 histidine kinase [Microbacterium sp. H1-D42]